LKTFIFRHKLNKTKYILTYTFPILISRYSWSIISTTKKATSCLGHSVVWWKAIIPRHFFRIRINKISYRLKFKENSSKGFYICIIIHAKLNYSNRILLIVISYWFNLLFLVFQLSIELAFFPKIHLQTFNIGSSLSIRSFHMSFSLIKHVYIRNIFTAWFI